MIESKIFLFSAIGLVGLVSALLVLIFKYGRTFAQRIWSAFNISILLWGIGAILVSLAGTPQKAILAWRIGICGSIFVGVTFLHFVSCFYDFRYKKFLLQFAYIQGLFFVISNISSTALFIE